MDPNDKHVTGLHVNDDTKAFAGYMLFTPAASTTTYLVDMEGQVVHRWDLDRMPGN